MAQQRLTAIMFTDLMGYTALMEKNESEALELVKKNRDLHQNAIKKYKGQLVKEMGDGFMATFDNALDAISCAREIQIEAKARKFDIPIRIGIHYGDITIDNEDIFGHGVNMASRIQSIADPGGIYISESIQKLVQDQTDLKTQYMGSVPLKNIKEPVPLYAIRGEGLLSPDKRRIDAIIRRSLYLKYYRYAAVGALLILAIVMIWFIRTYDIERGKISKSVAVLPLKNLSEDPEQEYLSTSLTEELIHTLSKINSLTVISQRSTRQYAGIGYTISEISRELNDVNYIVDGTVLLENNQIQTEIRLNDPTKEQLIWSKEYKQEVNESRQLWAEVARDLSRMMGVYMPEENIARLTGIKTVDPETYELYLKGMHAITKDSIDPELGLSYFNEAIERNPTDAYAWAAVATAHIYMGHGTHPKKEDRQKARAAALRAIQLDSTLAEAWSAFGMIKAYYDWEWEEAEQAYQKANALNPSLPMNHYHYSWYLNLFGRMNEAIREHKKAKELDPFEPLHTAFIGMIYFMVEEYDKAIREAKLAIEMKDKYLGKTILAKTYCEMGKFDEGMEIYQQLMNEYPEPRYYYLFLGVDYVLSGEMEEARKILCDMDTKYDTIPSSWGAWQRTEIYTALGDYDNAFKWFQFEPHHHFVPWIRVNWPLITKDSAFIKDPRFKELMRKFDLPDPAPYQYNPELDL